jgi:hypothetical protein
MIIHGINRGDGTWDMAMDGIIGGTTRSVGIALGVIITGGGTQDLVIMV